MKILYVAKHGGSDCNKFAINSDNDDEGAIAFALRKLGHEVICVHEQPCYRNPSVNLANVSADICLFHKWRDFSEMKEVKIPKVFWWFDIVHSDDPLLVAGSVIKRAWFEAVLPQCLCGFVTDGDFVLKDGSGKLIHLMQGADERVVGPGSPLHQNRPPVLFMGMVRHGMKRAQHIESLKARYGESFEVLGDSGPRYRKHGRELADIIASAKVMIAPDGPGTHLYHSNRVYQVMGFAGFLLHPFSVYLTKHYHPWELATYVSREHCFGQIDYYLERPEKAKQIAYAGYERTMRDHLYRHRCERLIEEVEKRLK